MLDLNTRTSTLRAAGVELISGEAAISLAGASSPFTVSAAGGRVMARDAVFELRHTDGSVCVTCLSGAVEVALASGGATLAARRLVYDAAGLQPARALDADDLPAWREGFLRFRQAPLAQVLDEINRYRSGRVILMAQSLAARPVSVRVELARLDTAIAQSRELPARRHRLARRRAAAGLIRPRAPAGESLPSAQGASFSMWSDHKTVCFSRVDPSR